MFHARPLAAALAAALLLGACAMDRSTTAAPAAPDAAPGATLLEGLGSHSFPVTSNHPEVQRWFAENGVEYLRSYPSAVLGSELGELFAAAEDNWRLEGWLAQIGWIRALGHEGGVFVTIGRRV